MMALIEQEVGLSYHAATLPSSLSSPATLSASSSVTRSIDTRVLRFMIEFLQNTFTATAKKWQTKQSKQAVEAASASSSSSTTTASSSSSFLLTVASTAGLSEHDSESHYAAHLMLPSSPPSDNKALFLLLALLEQSLERTDPDLQARTHDNARCASHRRLLLYNIFTCKCKIYSCSYISIHAHKGFGVECDDPSGPVPAQSVRTQLLRPHFLRGEIATFESSDHTIQLVHPAVAYRPRLGSSDRYKCNVKRCSLCYLHSQQPSIQMCINTYNYIFSAAII